MNLAMGKNDPQAIRDFMIHAYDNWTTKPRFLLLVGDSSFDYARRMNPSADEAPMIFFADHTYYIQIPNDSRFGYLSSTGPIPDIAIGRLPVNTSAELDIVIDKIQAYDAADIDNPAFTKALIINDDYTNPSDPGWETPFLESPVAYQQFAGDTFDIHHIDLTEVADADAVDDALEQFNNGVGFVYYMGHGSTLEWGDEQILLASTVDTNLTPVTPATPFILSMTCFTGNFVEVSYDSLAEEVMNAEQKGAVAMFASSGNTYPDPQRDFSEMIGQMLVNVGNSKTIGEIIVDAREALELEAFDEDVAHSYNLFGPPELYYKLADPNAASNSNDDNESTSPNQSVSNDSAANETPANTTTSTQRRGGGCSVQPGQSVNTSLLIIMLTALGLLYLRQRHSH